MPMIVDEPKLLFLIPEKVTHCAPVGHIGIQVLTIADLSVTIALLIVHTSHISKTNLPIVSLIVCKIELN